jgi:hypothetical protein
MHKPLLVSLSSDNNSRHFSDLGAAFEAERPPINISAIGGNEHNGTGVFAILIDDDTDARIARAVEIADGLGFRVDVIGSVTVELPNRPGELGRAGSKLDAVGINILSVLVVGARAGRALVSIGVLPEQEAAARDALSGLSILPNDLFEAEA